MNASRQHLYQRAHTGTSRIRTGFASLHLGLLIAVFPSAVIWYPLFKSPALGNLTVLDVVLVALWATTILRFYSDYGFFPLIRAANEWS